MYVHSVVLWKCVGLLVAIFWNSESVYTRFGIHPICSRHATEVFLTAKIFQNHKLEKVKEKFLYEVLSKQYDFAS